MVLMTKMRRTECCVSVYYQVPRVNGQSREHKERWEAARGGGAAKGRSGNQRWRCIDFYTTTTPPVAPPRCSPPLVVWARRLAPAATTHCSTRNLAHIYISMRHTQTHARANVWRETVRSIGI